MSIPEGLKAVNDVITSPNWDMARLIDAASKRANQELTPPTGFAPGIFFGVPACRTFYGATATGMSNELIAWFLGIILAEYAAGILAEKVRDGHCNAHRLAPAMALCPDMTKEHKKMLTAFKDRIKKLSDEIEALDRQTQVPAAPPLPVQASGS
jgi:hypothetical protein